MESDNPILKLHILNLIANNHTRGYLRAAEKIIIRMQERGLEPQFISDITRITIEEIKAVKEDLYI